MKDLTVQAAKARQLHHLHHNGKMLVLPNIWDPLGARMLESIGYPAIATASASIAYSNGYQDGENIPFDELLAILKKIVNMVEVPVTADIESGYAQDNRQLVEHIKKLIDTGIAGINFEDSDQRQQKLIPAELQSEKINLIKQTALEMGMPLFINARTDVYIKATHLSEAEKLQETIYRGNAYKDAGADCFYPILLKEKAGIIEIIREVSLPVNLLLLPGVPDFAQLKEMGLARLSLGPGFLKTALDAMKNVAEKLMHFEGMNDITENPVTSDYLKHLISKT